MAYPALFDPINLAVSNPIGQGWHAGPFSNTGNLFAIFADTSQHLFAFKSTDNGNTWSHADDAHQPANENDTMISCVTDGTRIFLSCYSPHLPNTGLLSIIPFNMSTGLWEAAITTTGAAEPNHQGALNSANVSTYSEVVYRPLIARRSNGDFVTPFCGEELVAGTTFFRTKAGVFQAGVWTFTGNIIGDSGAAHDDILVGCVLGSGDRTHVLYVEYATKTLRQVTIKSDNSVTATSQVLASFFDPGGVNTQSLAESIGEMAFNSASGEIAFAFKDTNGNLKVAHAASADVPVWTIEQADNTIVLYKSPSGQNGAQVSSVNYANGVLNATFMGPSGPGNVPVYRIIRAGGVWGNLRQLYAIPAAAGMLNSISSEGNADGSIGIVTMDNNANSEFFLDPAQGGGGSTAQLPIISLTFVLGFPSIRSCCFLCEQPERTGLPLPILRDKSLSYARYNTST